LQQVPDRSEHLARYSEWVSQETVRPVDERSLASARTRMSGPGLAIAQSLRQGRLYSPFAIALWMHEPSGRA